MTDESLDIWIGRMNDGDPAAVEHVLIAYEPYLRMAVRRRLGRQLQGKVDSVDVVQSVFASVLGGFRDGGGWRFAGRPQLSAFLRKIAWRRIADRYQTHRNELGHEQSFDATNPRNHPPSPSPRPSEVAQGREFWERVLQACPPTHREVVRLRVAGLRMTDVAERTGLHEGSVRRILYDLARRLSIGRRTAPGAANDE